MGRTQLERRNVVDLNNLQWRRKSKFHEFRHQQKLLVFPIINDLGEQILREF